MTTWTYPAGDTIQKIIPVTLTGSPPDQILEFAVSRGPGVPPVVTTADGSPPEVILTPVETGVQIEIPGSLTVDLEGLYEWQLRVTEPDGRIHTPAQGFVVITPSVLTPIPEGSPA